MDTEHRQTAHHDATTVGDSKQASAPATIIAIAPSLFDDHAAIAEIRTLRPAATRNMHSDPCGLAALFNLSGVAIGDAALGELTPNLIGKRFSFAGLSAAPMVARRNERCDGFPYFRARAVESGWRRHRHIERNDSQLPRVGIRTGCGPRNLPRRRTQDSGLLILVEWA